MARKKKIKFKSKHNAQKIKLKRSSTERSQNNKTSNAPTTPQTMPKKFPFWARLKICKSRTTLVIDEEQSLDKKSNKVTDNYIHREATSKARKGLEKIDPNPDKSKNEPMYLKRPAKLPKKMFKPHNKELSMPQHLKDLYDKNNDKKDK